MEGTEAFAASQYCGLSAWLVSIGLPQYAGPLTFLGLRDAHTKSQTSSSVLISNTLSAPVSHKIKLLKEMEKLKEQLCDVYDAKPLDAEQTFTLEANYLNLIGKENRAIKEAEDQLRAQFKAASEQPYSNGFLTLSQLLLTVQIY